jgi:hypothetical protein
MYLFAIRVPSIESHTSKLPEAPQPGKLADKRESRVDRCASSNQAASWDRIKQAPADCEIAE